MRRIVVTGIGTVSPLGNSFASSWNAAKSGFSGIRQITRFDTAHMEWKVAGELKTFQVEHFLSAKEKNRLDPFVWYALAAAVMAAEDALIDSTLLAHAGVIIGSSRGGISTIENACRKMFSVSHLSKRIRLSAYLMPATTVSMAASLVAQKLGMHGHCLGISNACASGTNAIGEAYRIIQSGLSEMILCGGAEAPISQICMAGYGGAGALSRMNGPDASRPFDRTRDGFVLSEGACILVLESLEGALARCANIYGEIIGYGNTADAYHQTVPSVTGEASAIKKALAEAGLQPGDIDFIAAHGTSTPLGDRTETEAIKHVFGKKSYIIPISALKSMTGHMLSASGALEAAFTLSSMKERVIFPTINLKERDPDCDLRYVTQLSTSEIRYALSQSFGFGGVNAVLVFKWIDS